MSLGSSRIFGLDILRASAILLVLLTHGVYYFTDSWDVFHIIKFIPDGVSIFFVLSGYLIGNILIKTMNTRDLKSRDLWNFWIRRWFRTLPAYYFVLSLLIAANLFLSETSKPLWDYLKYFLFLQALNNGNCPMYMESWSLCVEEFFYLFIPAFLFLLIKYTQFETRKIFVFCIVFVIATSSLVTIYKINSQQYTTIEDWDIFVRKTVFTRLNSIMFGFLGSYLMCYHFNLWKFKKIFMIAGLMLFIFLSVRPIFGIGPFFNYEQLTLESIATLLLIPQLSAVSHGKGILYKGLTFISTISYSIYLVNFTPFYLVQSGISTFFDVHSSNNSLLRLVLFLTWSIGVAYVVYKYVERPMMRKRELISHKEYSNIAYTYLEK